MSMTRARNINKYSHEFLDFFRSVLEVWRSVLCCNSYAKGWRVNLIYLTIAGFHLQLKQITTVSGKVISSGCYIWIIRSYKVKQHPEDKHSWRGIRERERETPPTDYEKRRKKRRDKEIQGSAKTETVLTSRRYTVSFYFMWYSWHIC